MYDKSEHCFHPFVVVTGIEDKNGQQFRTGAETDAGTIHYGKGNPEIVQKSSKSTRSRHPMNTVLAGRAQPWPECHLKQDGCLIPADLSQKCRFHALTAAAAARALRLNLA